MKIRRFILALLMCVLLSSSLARADEAPYYTLTETYDGQRVYSQNGYLPDKTFYDKLSVMRLKGPAVVKDDHTGNVCIARGV